VKHQHTLLLVIDYYGVAGFKGAQPFCQMSLARSCKGLLWLFGFIADVMLRFGCIGNKS